MPSERVQRQINSLLDQAELAISEMDWPRVVAAVGAVLAIDNSNEDALAFQKMIAGAGISANGDETISISPPEANDSRAPDPPSVGMPSSFADGRVPGEIGVIQ